MDFCIGKISTSCDFGKNDNKAVQLLDVIFENSSPAKGFFTGEIKRNRRILNLNFARIIKKDTWVLVKYASYVFTIHDQR